MKKVTGRLIACAALAFGVWLTTASAVTAAEPDSWITMKTKIALMTADNVSTSKLNVDTVKGVVTLHGTVPTEEQKTNAEQVAMKIDGVKSVKNLLQVVPKSERAVVERADDQVKSDVQAAFKANARVRDSGISVASVNKGVVLLSGKVDALPVLLEAVQVADAVKGVRRVSSEVEVRPAKTH